MARQEEEQEEVFDHNSSSRRRGAWQGGEEDSPHLILAAAGFPEVGDGGQLCVDGLGVEPSVVQVHDRFLCVLLATELHTCARVLKAAREWAMRSTLHSGHPP